LQTLYLKYHLLAIDAEPCVGKHHLIQFTIGELTVINELLKQLVCVVAIHYVVKHLILYLSAFALSAA
jgi:hypothetical protein